MHCQPDQIMKRCQLTVSRKAEQSLINKMPMSDDALYDEGLSTLIAIDCIVLYNTAVLTFVSRKKRDCISFADTIPFHYANSFVCSNSSA